MPTKKKVNFNQRCDHCKAIVIDTLENYNNYTVTITTPIYRLGFYCRDCIEKYSITTDDIKALKYQG